MACTRRLETYHVEDADAVQAFVAEEGGTCWRLMHACSFGCMHACMLCALGRICCLILQRVTRRGLALPATDREIVSFHRCRMWAHGKKGNQTVKDTPRTQRFFTSNCLTTHTCNICILCYFYCFIFTPLISLIYYTHNQNARSLEDKWIILLISPPPSEIGFLAGKRYAGGAGNSLET